MFTNTFLNIFRNLRVVNQTIPSCVTIISSLSSSSSSSWSKVESTMKQLIYSKQYAEVLDLYNRHFESCSNIGSNLALKACTKLADYESGIRIHQQLSLESRQDPFIQTALIHFYMRCRDVDQAQKIFSSIDRKTIYMYGAMFKGYVSNGLPEKVLELFDQMSLNPNKVIITILFNACAKLANAHAMTTGKMVVNQLSSVFRDDQILMNSAIDMLMKFGDVADAERLFQSVKKKSIVTCGVMMNGYVFNDLSDKALDLFETIPFQPDEFLYAILYNACASLFNERAVHFGKKLLDQMPKKYFDDVILINSAIHMLMKFGDVKEAESLYTRIPKPNIVVYGVMMNGYNINHEPRQCLKLLEQIHQQNIILNEPTSVSLISACSQIGLISTCQRILNHIPLHFHKNPRLANVLIDMWGKVGVVNEAEKIFQSISERNVFIYTTMINAYGRNGMGAEAVDLYRKMPEDMRNAVSHICVLNACSHSGLINEARSIFNNIETKTEKIITVMIDCFSRMFMFDQAKNLMDDYEKSNAPSLIMYMSLLSGARNHRQSNLSQNLYDRMKLLFPEHKSDLIAASILLSNTYSSIGDHQQAEEVRTNRIKQFGNKIKPGLAWTEVNDELLEFRAHDHSHHRSAEIYAELRRLSDEMKEHGHQYDSSWIIRPLKEGESVESVLCGHSEKLAIAYNLIQQPRPSFIQVTKNLRVCGDCHHATKLIAKIRQCDIVVRDANRIHHFRKNGQCSCQDHF